MASSNRSLRAAHGHAMMDERLHHIGRDVLDATTELLAVLRD
jgi:hypothetical protein